MKKKIRLFSTLATICLCAVMLAVGVFSAISITYKTKGTISYDIEDTYVEIETRIYSTSKKFDDSTALKTKAQEFESSSFASLDELTTTGIVDGEEIHDFTKVQIKNLNQGDDYEVQDSDYQDIYSSVTVTSEPEDLAVELAYQTAQGEDKGVYTYFVITKLVNKSSIPLYAYIPTEGDDKYVASENSHNYKMETEYKELSTLNSEVYIVFAMGLDDITVAIEASDFVYPVAVTKNNINLVNITLNIDGIDNEIGVSKNMTLQQAIESTGLGITEYNSCGWYIDRELTQVADLTAKVTPDMILYTKTATTEALSFSIENEYAKFNVTSASQTVEMGHKLNNINISKREIVIPQIYQSSGGNYPVKYGSITDDVTDLVLPSNFTVIWENQFKDKTNLKSINFHNKITQVQTSAFENCSNLQSDIIISKDVTTIGQYAFKGCYSLEVLTIEEGNDIYKTIINDSGSNCIVEKTGIELKLLVGTKNCVIPENITSIEPYAFYNCEGLQNINLPSTLKKIGEYAFYNCTNLNAVEIPSNVNTISDYAFAKSGIKDLIFIPSSNLLSLNDKMFSECYNLINLDFGDFSKITQIPDNIFAGCANLYSVDFGDNSQLLEIGTGAFQSCIRLTILNFGLNSKVEKIAHKAFEGCLSLVSLKLPSTVTCSQILSDNVTEHDIREDGTLATLVGKVTGNYIQYPFYNSLIKLVQVESDINIYKLNGISTFNYWEEIGVAGNTGFEYIDVGGVFTNKLEFGEKYITYTIGSKKYLMGVTDYSIKTIDNLDSYGITDIYKYALATCTNLETLIIPKNVDSIGEFAFGSSGVKTVVLPNVSDISTDFLYNCVNLTDVYYGGYIKDVNNRIKEVIQNLGATLHTLDDEGWEELVDEEIVATCKNAGYKVYQKDGFKVYYRYKEDHNFVNGVCTICKSSIINVVSSNVYDYQFVKNDTIYKTNNTKTNSEAESLITVSDNCILTLLFDLKTLGSGGIFRISINSSQYYETSGNSGDYTFTYTLKTTDTVTIYYKNGNSVFNSPSSKYASFSLNEFILT